MSIESRNHRLTRKQEQKQRQFAKRSHSCIPGQCNHEHVQKEERIDLEASKWRAENSWRKEFKATEYEVSPQKEVNSEVDPNDLTKEQDLGFSPSDISVIESNISTNKINQPCVYDMKEKIGGDNSQSISIYTYPSRKDYDEFWNARMWPAVEVYDGEIHPECSGKAKINVKFFLQPRFSETKLA